MDKIADLLSSLAAKLGTTVEYLWPKLVAHTRYDWLGKMCASLIVLSIGLFFARIANTAWRERVITRVNHWGQEERNVPDIDFVYTALAFFFTLTGLFITLLNIADISQFLAPEAATILQLLDKLKR